MIFEHCSVKVASMLTQNQKTRLFSSMYHSMPAIFISTPFAVNYYEKSIEKESGL